MEILMPLTRIIQKFTSTPSCVVATYAAYMMMSITLCAYEPSTHQKMGRIARRRFEKALLPPDESRTNYFPSIGSLMNPQQQEIDESLFRRFHLWLAMEDLELRSTNVRDHFWNPVNGRGLYTFDSAVLRASQLYDRAIELYFDGQGPQAYEDLGRVCHLVGDVACPAHTLLDPHYDLSAGDVADPDIDTLHEYSGREMVVGGDDSLESPFHWSGASIARTDESINDIMRPIALSSAGWDSDDVNGLNKVDGNGNLNGNTWNINTKSPWYIDLWNSGGLPGFPSELIQWIDYNTATNLSTADDVPRRLVGYLLEIIPEEIISTIKDRPDKDLGPEQRLRTVEALQEAILGFGESDESSRRELWEHVLHAPTIEWAGATRPNFLVDILIDGNMFDFGVKTDSDLFQRRKLGILLEMFPISLEKRSIDSRMLRPINEGNLKRIAVSNIQKAEEGIAKVLRKFFDDIRPKISILNPPRVVVDQLGGSFIETGIRIGSRYRSNIFGSARGLKNLKVKISDALGRVLYNEYISVEAMLRDSDATIDNIPLRLPSSLFSGSDNILQIWAVDLRGVESYPVKQSVTAPKDSAGPLVRNYKP